MPLSEILRLHCDRIWVDDETGHSARGAALIASLATAGRCPDGAFPAAALAAEPDIACFPPVQEVP